jgi:hypothetical protein
MKFFYNDKLVRTSKTMNYTHAVIRDKENGEIVTWGCSSTLAGAQKALIQARKINNTYRIVELDRKG